MKVQATTRDAYQLFHKGLLALAQIEHNGIKVNLEYVDRTIKETQERIKSMEEELKKDEIWVKWKRRFKNASLTSRDQLAEVMFGIMGEKPKLFTKKGRPSTEEAAFADIDNPFIKAYFKIEKQRKVLSTYLLPIKREQYDSVLHCSYSLAGGSADDEGKGGAMSYRSACSMINFQNLPIRIEEMARLIRQCFMARGDDFCLVETDFSQLEVRIAECYNHDPVLKRYIEDKTTDMHRDAAALLFKCDQKFITKQLRHIGKNRFVFPEFYGSYYVDVAKSVWEETERQGFKLEGKKLTAIQWLAKQGITSLGKCDEKQSPRPGTFEYHIKQVEDHFWNKQFKVYTDWKKKWYAKYLTRGWFPLYTGFRCVGEYRRNQVLNFSIQGSAFHCLLWCIIQINKELKRKKMRSRIVGQIHDSIIGDVHKNEIQDYLTICHRVMTVDLPKHYKWINVEMEMTPDVAPFGGTWHQKKEWELKGQVWGAKV
jgi:DNA polymerase-1